MPPVNQRGKGNNRDDSYRDHRNKNNEAVKKSRFKSKQRSEETSTRVSKLKAENQILEEKVKSLTKGLQLLKELFLAHTSRTQNITNDGTDLETILQDIPDEKNDA
ncbi:CCAAT/enhancer-binding protein gamma-like [Hyposmocoma kahamanoa]|uniref:CCAAT/enhancer-binding protein gamma-like n=1 Tax=Hyposmocoma kahamanoa TaxID=1477025 RepID=UPI000E6D6CE6|nr:CCAAT/enhancer-binding protein gamma-like [Hyposmocoma kahamanoa]